MQIREPIVFQIANKTWCINEFGMDTLFLLEGSEKALLIDTGTGVFDLPALVRTCTDKPLQVVLTHGHTDHAGGMHWFDKVSLHPDDFPLARAVLAEDRKNYVRTMMSMSEGLYAIGPDDVASPGKTPDLLPLSDGDVLHLGGRDVAVYETPGHTTGSLSFLDVRERILFTGDACNPNTLLACSAGVPGDRGTMSSLLASARKIQRLQPYYDRNYNGHIGYAAHITRIDPMPVQVTRDCIELCADLLSGKQTGVPNADSPFVGECLLARNKTMQILYQPSQLR